MDGEEVRTVSHDWDGHFHYLVISSDDTDGRDEPRLISRVRLDQEQAEWMCLALQEGLRVIASHEEAL